MKVRVTYVVKVPDRFRAAINHYYGKPGLASRQDIKTFYEQNGGSILDDVISAYEDFLEESSREKEYR